MEEDLALADVHLVAGAAIVEARVEDDFEDRLAPHALRPANERAAVLALVADGHEVRDLRHAVAIEGPGDEHVRVGKVHLLDLPRVETRADLEPAAVLGVE